jgi:hypothetical protein
MNKALRQKFVVMDSSHPFAPLDNAFQFSYDLVKVLAVKNLSLCF